MVKKKMIKIKELPITTLLENNIIDDIVYSTDTINSQFDKVNKKLANKEEMFIMVVYDKSKDKIIGVIDIYNLENVLDLYSNNPKIRFKDLKLNKPKTLKDTAKIKDAWELFNKDDEPSFIVLLNKNDNYIGKISLNNFIEKIKELTK